MLRCKASYIKQPPPDPEPEVEPVPLPEPYVSEVDVHLPIMIFILGFVTLAVLHPLE